MKNQISTLSFIFSTAIYISFLFSDVKAQSGCIIDLQDSTANPCTVYFTSSVMLPTVQLDLTSDWNFGDGQISTLRNPVHTYSASGTYDVCLIVTVTIYMGVTKTVYCKDTLCKKVTVQCVTEIYDFDQEQSISVYPNPSDGKFILKSNGVSIEKCEIEIYNLLGEKIYCEKMPENDTEIDLKNNAKGMYFYKIISDDKKIPPGKLIIQ